MSEHKNDGDTAIEVFTAAPTLPPPFAGKLVAEIPSDATKGRCLRVATGTNAASDYKVIGITPQAYAGDPNGVKTSRCVGDVCIDTTNSKKYLSLTANSTTWQLQDRTGGGGGGS